MQLTATVSLHRRIHSLRGIFCVKQQQPTNVAIMYMIPDDDYDSTNLNQQAMLHADLSQIYDMSKEKRNLILPYEDRQKIIRKYDGCSVPVNERAVSEAGRVCATIEISIYFRRRFNVHWYTIMHFRWMQFQPCSSVAAHWIDDDNWSFACWLLPFAGYTVSRYLWACISLRRQSRSFVESECVWFEIINCEVQYECESL